MESRNTVITLVTFTNYLLVKGIIIPITKCVLFTLYLLKGHKFKLYGFITGWPLN